VPLHGAPAGLGSRQRSTSKCRGTRSPAAPCTWPRTGGAPPTRGVNGGQRRSPRGWVASRQRGGAMVWRRCGGEEEDEGSLRRGCPAMATGHDFIGAASGGRARVVRIFAISCSDATTRCAAAQSYRRCSYSAQEARRRASGDDEPSVVSLIVGHATKHTPSRRPRSPPPLDRVWIRCGG
jgi:hypothetical protein